MSAFDKDQLHNSLISIPELADNFYLRERIADILVDISDQIEEDIKIEMQGSLDEIENTLNDIVGSLEVMVESDDLNYSISDLETLLCDVQDMKKRL